MNRAIVVAVVFAGALAGCSGDGGSESRQPTIAANEASATVAATEAGPDAEVAATPDDGLVTLLVEGSAGSAEVHAEIARTSEQVTTGLMHRESLPGDQGMLFIFDPPSNIGFWMHDTLIPLDIAYLADDGRIREIRQGQPLDETILRPQLPYSYVLEVNAGWFASHGLGVGDRVQIPAEAGKG
jgi:hypothetical protein